MRHTTTDLTADPNWRSPEDPRLSGLQGLGHWLLDNGSLTRRLIDSGRQFRVARLHQGWSVPRLSERHVLHMRPRQLALIREVLLLLDETPVVFARSVFPYSSLCGGLAHLRKLQGSSLGAILFSHADMRRSPFQIARLHGSSHYLPAAVRQTRPAWARRSIFQIDRQPLLVSEVFLESFSPPESGYQLERGNRGRINAAILRAKQ